MIHQSKLFFKFTNNSLKVQKSRIPPKSPLLKLNPPPDDLGFPSFPNARPNVVRPIAVYPIGATTSGLLNNPFNDEELPK
jgi:hypothetical protein